MELENVLYKKIINGLSLKFQEGKIYSIISSSDSEKEILGKIISGIINDYDGKIINKNKIISYNYKNPEDMLIEDTVLKELSLALKDNNKENTNKRCTDALKIVGLDSKCLNYNPHYLSSSEKKLLSIAINLITNPKIIVLDEPFNYLDTFHKKEIIKLFKKIAKKYNKIVIIFTKDVLEAYDTCDNFILLKNGKIIERGPKKELINISDKIKDAGLNVPKIIDFVNITFQRKKIYLNNTFDIKELMKDIYRNVK